MPMSFFLVQKDTLRIADNLLSLQSPRHHRQLRTRLSQFLKMVPTTPFSLEGTKDVQTSQENQGQRMFAVRRSCSVQMS